MSKKALAVVPAVALALGLLVMPTGSIDPVQKRPIHFAQNYQPKPEPPLQESQPGWFASLTREDLHLITAGNLLIANLLVVLSLAISMRRV